MKSLFNYILLVIILYVAFWAGKFCYNISEDIKTLKVNQNLILLQLQDEENNINNIEEEIDKIDFLINKYSNKYGVDKSLAHSVAIVESGKKQKSVSRSGSIGVYQLQPNTAKHLGVNPYDLEDNIKGGIQYLAYLHKKFDYDEELVLSAYNAGLNNVIKYNGVPPFSETQRYISKVQQEKYKIDNKNG